MANGFKTPQAGLKAPSRRGRSGGIEQLFAGILMRDELKRQQEERKPALAAETAEETERAKRKFAVDNAYTNLRNDFKQMRDLTLQVSNSMPGIIGRAKGGTKNYLSVISQDPTGVMLGRHQNIVDSSLRNIAILRSNETESRFSNEDARRMQKLFGEPVWDTELKEDVDFAENARTLDSRARDAGVEFTTSLFDEMFPESIGDIKSRKGASRILLGDLIRDSNNVDNDELIEGTKRITKFQSIRSLNPALKEIILNELEKRGIDI